MKIFVAIKEVPDPVAPVRLGIDNTVALLDSATQLNPFDEIALEAALTLKDDGAAREVVTVAVGPAAWEGSLRTTLAMGADRAILLETPPHLPPRPVSRCLRWIATREQPDLIITGRQAVDSDWTQTGPMLAGMLGWPQACFASALAMVQEGIQVTREVDGGLETVLLTLPAVITADLRLNQPRYASLPAILAARRKPVERLVPEVDLTPGLTILGHGLPRQRPAGVRVRDARELLERLRERLPGQRWDP